MKYISTGIRELDRLLGGGFVRGSVVLLAGPPKSCKSTLMIQATGAVAMARSPWCYVAWLGLAKSVLAVATRVGARNASVRFVESLDYYANEPVLIVDDLQYTARRMGISVLCLSDRLHEIAEEKNAVVVLISQTNKDHSIQVPHSVEHDVDTVIYMNTYDVLDDKLGLCKKLSWKVREAEAGVYRLLVVEKNRFALDGGQLLFKVTEKGLAAV